MQLSQSTAGRELFFVLEDFCEQLFTLRQRLASLSRFVAASQLAGVDALYERDKDLGLLCLRFDLRRLDSAIRARLVDEATEAGIPVLDPQRLVEADRRLFYQRYLRSFTVRVDDHHSPAEAMEALGRLLGFVDIEDEELASKTELVIDAENHEVPTTVGGPIWSPLKTVKVAPPDETDIPLILMPPEKELATGSQNELVVDDADEAKTSLKLGPPGEWRAQGKGRDHRSKTRQPTVPATPSTKQSSNPSRRLPLAPRQPRSSQQPPPRAKPRSSAPPALPRPPSAPSHRPDSAPPLHDPRQGSVRVRFQRGDEWMPARLRNLSTREVRLAASAAPPLGHALRVSITIGDYGLVLSGIVVEVINTERSVDGSTSFRLQLHQGDRLERERLVELLRKAQREKISLTPPPARKSRRFAISWPLALVSDGHRINAAALDISDRGLFVATTTMIRSRQVVFGIPLDNQTKIQGRARIVRQVDEDMAREQGLATGYGLHIEGLAAKDQKQFESFVQRVRRRSQQHIIVAGAGQRSSSLAECFQAAGYAVSKAPTVDTLLRRRAFETSTPDLAVIDTSALSGGERAHFESTFREHQVQVLHLSGQPLQSARDILDRYTGE